MLNVLSVNRSFGERRVLTDVSFDVGPGRLAGFVGANGAGKTTTMRIILGVLGADSGEVRWHGRRPARTVRRRFGYMPEERGLYPKMSVRDQLVFLGRLHGLGPQAARRNTEELLSELGLAERGGDVLEALSLGNQQRVQIAAALVHEPELLVLDEPFSGLDPMAVDSVMRILRAHTARGVPVLFSSHQLDVVERLCDDLVIIAGGSVRAAGSRDELRAKHAAPRFELVVGEDAGWLRDLPGVCLAELDGPRAEFELDGDVDEQHILADALRRGPVRRFGPVIPSLAEIFREVTQ